MHTRPLTYQDAPMLQALLMRDPVYNVFHLSAMVEHGSEGEEAHGPWAVGAFEGEELVGAVVAMRGTGGVYHLPEVREALDALAPVVVQKAKQGALTLLSGHESQVGAILPLLGNAGTGPADNCYFRTLKATELQAPPPAPGFRPARLGTPDDMERLIDFYQVGFYSLARLPSRAAWRNRLNEQLSFRTLYLVEDAQGRVASAAMSSAEAGGAAMLGGVATLAEYRGKGLSAHCVGALCAHLFARDFNKIALFYLEDNDPAARVYVKLGFRDAGRWLLVPLGLGASFAPLFNMRSG